MLPELLHLSLINGIGPAAIQRVLQLVSVSELATLYTFKETDFIVRCGFTEALATKAVAGLADKDLLERELLLLQKYSINAYSIFDEAYPALLKQIYLPPPILYVKGTLPASKALAVVGSRLANAYARYAIDLLLPLLIAYEWTIVSGGALGADTFAHQATLKHNGTTVVVLGSGLLRPYPAQNRKLFDAVVENNGAIISSFALEQIPLPGNFPARNRIISGISYGCLVIQAAQKSGACITAHHALEQGKEVFVVPGPLNDPLSAGGHALIQQGAKLVTSTHDILAEFNETIQSPLQSATNAEQVVQLSCLQEASHTLDKKPFSDPFLQLCVNPISIEDLQNVSQFSLLELQTKLFDLQIEGKITQNFAGLWQVV